MANVRTLKDLGGAGKRTNGADASQRSDFAGYDGGARRENKSRENTVHSPALHPLPALPHPVRLVVTEVGLRHFSDEIIATLGPQLKNFYVPNLHFKFDENHGNEREAAVVADRHREATTAHAAATAVAADDPLPTAHGTNATPKRSSVTSASLRDICFQVDVADSMTAVMEDHVMWRLKADVEIDAAYAYVLRYRCLSDNGHATLRFKNISLTLKLVDTPSDDVAKNGSSSFTPNAASTSSFLDFGVIRGSPSSTSLLTEPRVDFEGLQLAARSKSRNPFKRFLTSCILAPFIKRTLRGWLSKEAGPTVGEVINRGGPSKDRSFLWIKRRWRWISNFNGGKKGKDDGDGECGAERSGVEKTGAGGRSAIGRWKFDFNMRKKVGYLLGKGVIFGGNLGSERFDGMNSGGAGGGGGRRQEPGARLCSESPPFTFPSRASSATSTNMDEEIEKHLPSFGLRRQFVLFLRREILQEALSRFSSNLFSASPSSTSSSTDLDSFLAAAVGTQAAFILQQLQLPSVTPSSTGVRAAMPPRVSTSVVRRPSLRLSCTDGVVADAEVCLEVKADAASLARYPGDVIYFRVIYTFSVGSQPQVGRDPEERQKEEGKKVGEKEEVGGADNDEGDDKKEKLFDEKEKEKEREKEKENQVGEKAKGKTPIERRIDGDRLFLRLTSFQGKAKVEAARIPGLSAASEDFQALKLNVERLVENAAQDIWMQQLETIGERGGGGAGVVGGGERDKREAESEVEEGKEGSEMSEKKAALLEVGRLPTSFTRNRWAELKTAEIRIFDGLLAFAFDVHLKEELGKQFQMPTGDIYI